jgi:hypothetical protein
MAQDLLPDQTGDAALREEIRTTYAPLIRSIEQRRRPLEEVWLRALAAWKAEHTRPGFRGEWFNHYIPALRRAVERFVTRTVQMLFPSTAFFDVQPMSDSADEDGLATQAAAWQGYLTWLLTTRIRARSLVKQAVRCFLLFQRAIVKTGLDVQHNDRGTWVWPMAWVVDPFALYVWPETVTALEDAELIFEHTLMPWERYRAHAASGVADPLDRRELTTPEWPTYYVRRLQQSGFSVPTDAQSGPPAEGQAPPTPSVAFVSLTELWFRREARWVQAWVVWNVAGGPRVVRVRFAQFPVPPYRMALARQLPGEHYTSSMASDLEPLNVLLNDEVNMTLEGQATALNPPAVVNPDLVARADTFVFRPRAKWLGDPAGVKWMEPPNTLSAGFQGIQMTLGFIDSFSGSNPLAEGQPTRGMPRAGFAVSSLIGLSMADIKDVAETIEDELLTPLLMDCYTLTLRFVPPQQVIVIPGSEAVARTRITAQELMAPMQFRWIGSLQSQDVRLRAQQELTVLNVLGRLYEPMVRQGWDIDFGLLGKHLWRDTVGGRMADKIIRRVAPGPPPGAVPAAPPAAGPVAPGGPMAGAVMAATPEQAERQVARGFAEGQVPAGLAGLRAG